MENKKPLPRLPSLIHLHETEANNKEEFVPPKPKELDMAALTVISFESVRGMKSSLKTGSGPVRLSVNGAIPCNDALMEKRTINMNTIIKRMATCSQQSLSNYTIFHASEGNSTCNTEKTE